MTDAVVLSVDEGVATITLNRPDAKNRLAPEAMQAVIVALRAAEDDPSVRVTILASTGNTFCAGADMSSALASTGGFGDTMQLLVDMYSALLDHPLPLIARVQGHVAGGGNGLVAACDIAVAAAEAKFAFTEVRVGVSPAVVAVVCQRVMTPRDAAELLLTGERVSAQRALRAGLVTKVVESEQLDAAVDAYVDAFRQSGPVAVRMTKSLLRRLPTMDRDEAFAMTSRQSAEVFASPEAREGMTAFFEKRSPSWAP